MKEGLRRNEKSIIAYILVKGHNKRVILDTGVRHGPETGSDHYAIITEEHRECEELSEKKFMNLEKECSENEQNL